MQKKIMSLTLAVALIFSLSLSVLAATPRWSYTGSCEVTLGFSGSTANNKVTILGNTNVSKISATVLLQRYNGSGYTTVKTWDETVNSTKYTLNATYPGCAAGDYRLYVSATVTTKEGKSEVVSNYATATK